MDDGIYLTISIGCEGCPGSRGDLDGLGSRYTWALNILGACRFGTLFVLNSRIRSGVAVVPERCMEDQ